MRDLFISLLKAPLLHFLLGGVVLFALYTALLPPEKEEILISRQTVSALVQERQELSREPLSDEELMSLIDAYADEEVLIREAYKQGMDRNNYQVRKQILDLMRSTLSAVIPRPTAEQLKQYYQENREDFTIPELRNFSHVYYRSDNSSSPKDLSDFRARFKEAGEEFSSAGDPFPQGNEFSHLSFEQCALFFGRSFAQALFSLPPDSWAGPLPSGDGVHYVLMGDIFESRIPSFEDIAAYLEESYRYSKNREVQQEKTDKLRENYSIRIEEF